MGVSQQKVALVKSWWGQEGGRVLSEREQGWQVPRKRRMVVKDLFDPEPCLLRI